MSTVDVTEEVKASEPERSGSAEIKIVCDELDDDIFGESSPSSEDDDIYIKTSPLQFSSSGNSEEKILAISPKMPEEKVVIRCLLRHYWKKEFRAKAASEEICAVESENVVYRVTAALCFWRSNSGNYGLQDEPRSGRPSEVDDAKLLESVSQNPYATTQSLPSERDSDVELKSSEEDELLNLYDKKLRDNLYSKRSDDEDPEQMTSRIGEYLKRMRAEEKILIGNMKNSKTNEEEIAQNRKNKEAILKRFDYKDQLRRMKSQNFFHRFDSSESESDAGSDLDMDALTKTMDKIGTDRSHSEKLKTLETARQSFMSRNTDVRKKIAEMKKILDNPELQEEEDQLFKTKQAVSDWLAGEGAAAFKKHFNTKPPSKFRSDTTIKDVAGKKMSRIEAKKTDRNPLPPVRTKRATGQIADNFKKEDVLKILREIDSTPLKAKSLATGLEKPSILKNAKKPVASKVNSGLPPKLLKSKSDFSRTTSKTNLTKNPTNKTTAK